MEGVADQGAEIADVVHLLACEAHDHVAGRNACTIDGGAGLDFADQQSLLDLEIVLPREFPGERFDADAEVRRTMRPWRWRLSSASRTTFDGTANPTPCQPPARPAAMAVLMPATSPRMFTSGPPELPGLARRGAPRW